MIRLLNKSAIW